jgi:hypothetical protein
VLPLALILSAWPTTDSSNGPKCATGAAIELTSGDAPRLPALAIEQKVGGLAVWLAGGKFVAQPLTDKGALKGKPVESELDASVLDALVYAKDTFVLLYRADGASQKLGAADQSRVRLLALDAKGARLAGPVDVTTARWRDHPQMRVRGGALRVWIYAREGTKVGTISLPNLELSFETAAGDWRSSALGPYWYEGKDLQVLVDPDKSDPPQYVFRRVFQGKDHGQSLTLPLHVLDYYKKDGDTLLVDNMFVQPKPTLAFSGSQYFVTQVAQKGGKFTTALLPITCK